LDILEGNKMMTTEKLMELEIEMYQELLEKTDCPMDALLVLAIMKSALDTEITLQFNRGKVLREIEALSSAESSLVDIAQALERERGP
jgi:hypothetical protein